MKKQKEKRKTKKLYKTNLRAAHQTHARSSSSNYSSSSSFENVPELQNIWVVSSSSSSSSSSPSSCCCRTRNLQIASIAGTLIGRNSVFLRWTTATYFGAGQELRGNLESSLHSLVVVLLYTNSRWSPVGGDLTPVQSLTEKK